MAQLDNSLNLDGLDGMPAADLVTSTTNQIDFNIGKDAWWTGAFYHKWDNMRDGYAMFFSIKESLTPATAFTITPIMETSEDNITWTQVAAGAPVLDTWTAGKRVGYIPIGGPIKRYLRGRIEASSAPTAGTMHVYITQIS